MRIEACGICPTDARKFAIGVNDGAYPFNPGHEWVGRVVALGAGVAGWEVGARAYGDTYAGYAEYATIATRARRLVARGAAARRPAGSSARSSWSRWRTACTACTTRAGRRDGQTASR